MNCVLIGGNRGIGKAMLQQLTKDPNKRIIATSRDFGLSTDKQITYAPLDITEDESIENFIQIIEKKFTHIDLLINCAGVLHSNNFRPEKSLKQVNSQQMLETMMSNSIGHMLLIKALEKHLKKAQAAVVTSISARIGSLSDNKLGGWYAYRMSKAALNMAFKTLSIEWKRNHPQIQLLLFHPGTTKTDLSEPFQKNLPQGQLQTAEFTAQRYLSLIEDLQQKQINELFIDYNGKSIPW